MSEKFLVVGSTSFYGSNFCDLVRERGGEVTEMRLGDPLPKDPLQYVVNFASKSLVAESWGDPGEWMNVNGVITTQFFDQLRQVYLEKYIHVSTPEVYGSTPTWVSEDAPFNPSTPYAVSRAAGDMMLKAFGKAYGLPYVITRTANIYGPGQQDFRLIPKAINAKLNDDVFILQGAGTNTRSFIHVRDACEATYLLARKGLEGETYHISTDYVTSIRDVVDMIGCQVKAAEARLGNDNSYMMNSAKMQRLGWRSKVPLSEGIKECTSVLLASKTQSLS